MPFPSPGDLPDPGIEPRSPTLQADAINIEEEQKSYTSLIGYEKQLYFIQSDKSLIGLKKGSNMISFLIHIF